MGGGAEGRVAGAGKQRGRAPREQAAAATAGEERRNRRAARDAEPGHLTGRGGGSEHRAGAGDLEAPAGLPARRVLESRGPE